MVAVTPRRNGLLQKATRASPPRWNFSSRRDSLRGSGARFYQAGKKATAVLVSRRTETRELQRYFHRIFRAAHRVLECAAVIEIVLVALGMENLDSIGPDERRWTDQTVIFEDRQTRFVWGGTRRTRLAGLACKIGLVNWSDKGGERSIAAEPGQGACGKL